MGALGLPSYLHDSFKRIAKLNIGTDIRQAYEANIEQSLEVAQEAVYKRVLEIVDELQIGGSAAELVG